MPAQKLIDFLNEHQIKFVTIRHSKAYTANEIAHSAHIHGQELAKTVMVKIDGKMTMVVVSASGMVNLDFLKMATGSNNVVLASEQEFVNMFPGCEAGAMPPFGNLFGMDVYVAKTLTENREIVFNAGSLTELIRMSYSDFEKLVNPKIVRF